MKQYFIESNKYPFYALQQHCLKENEKKYKSISEEETLVRIYVHDSENILSPYPHQSTIEKQVQFITVIFHKFANKEKPNEKIKRTQQSAN